MKISKKNQAIIDSFKTEKEKNDFILELKNRFVEYHHNRYIANKQKIIERVRSWISKSENKGKVEKYKAKYRKKNLARTSKYNHQYYLIRKAKTKEIETNI
jgi:hypothetical protein